MQVEQIFPTPIAIIDLSLEDLENVCLDIEQENQGQVRSNMGGYQSTTEMIFDERFAQLREEVEASIRGIFQFEPKMINGWVNINRKGGANRRHIHQGSKLSAVYYVTNAYSPIRFHDPRPMNVWDNGPTTETFNPTMGQLLIFPSWLEHDVEPNETDKTRISIAMNIGV